MTDLGPEAYTRWLFAFWVLSTSAGGGLVWTVARPDSHPITFAWSLAWIIVVLVSAIIRNIFLGIDPKRFGFARWEREGRVYHRVGLPAFRWLLQHTPLGWLNARVKLTCCRSGLDRLLREMGYAEGAHLVGGVVTLGFAAVYAGSGHAIVALSLGLITIPSHVYPVMLQRWNRGRVLRVNRRINKSDKR